MDGGIGSDRMPLWNNVIQARWDLSDHLADRTRSPNLRAIEAVEADVDVAERGEEEGVVDADVIGHKTLQQRDERGTQDSHHQQAGSKVGERAKLGKTEGENIWPHDGVEEADQNDAPHSDVAEGQHGCNHQAAGDDGGDSQYRTGAQFLGDAGAAETPNHGAAPIERDIEGGGFLRHVADVGLIQIVDEETSNRDFGADVDENRNHTEDQVALRPDAGECCRRGPIFIDGCEWPAICRAPGRMQKRPE